MARTTDPKQPEPAASPGIQASRYNWYVILLLTAVNLLSSMDRMALAVLLPFIKADLHISDGQAGLLIGLAFSIFYGVCGIPFGRWADRGVRRDIIALSILVWSVMTALSGAAHSFWHMLVARIGLGASEAGVIPSSQSIICDYVPVERRPGAFAIHAFGLTAGIMIGMAAAGYLAEWLGWRWAFVVLAGVGLPLTLLVRFTLREPDRGAMDGAASDLAPVPLRDVARRLSRNRSYMLLTIVVVLSGFIQYGMNQWWPSLYAQRFELGLGVIGARLGLAIGIGSATGLIVGGVIANRLAARAASRALALGTLTYLVSIPVALLSIFAATPSIAIVAAGASVLLWSIPSGAIVSSLYSVVPVNIRATAGTITAFCTALFGFGLGPAAVGLLSDALSHSQGAFSLRYAMMLPPAFAPVMALVIFIAARSLSLRPARETVPAMHPADSAGRLRDVRRNQ